MSHAGEADKLLIKPAAGARPGAAAHVRTDHSQGTHEAASHLTSSSARLSSSRGFTTAALRAG